MRRRCQYAPIKWLCGIILLSLGIGMLLGLLIPYCIPILALLFIGLGGWLVTRFKQC